MVVMIFERAPAGLRGELSRWLMEIRAGVFLGHVSALVRDGLFEHCKTKLAGGGMVMVFPAQTEQGFRVRVWGKMSREVVDVEGLYLMRVRVPVRVELAARGGDGEAGAGDGPEE